MCGRSLLVILDPHLFNQAIQAFVVLCLTDCPGGKKSVEQILLATKQLQLLFSGNRVAQLSDLPAFFMLYFQRKSFQETEPFVDRVNDRFRA